MQETIFDKLIRDEIPNWKVWQDENYLAFLTPFANTSGVTVVIPKSNPGDYIFDVSDDVFVGLLEATKKVAKVLEKAFNTKIAMVFEGTGVPYLHAKLYPMHSVYSFDESKVSHESVFYDSYQGFITTQPGPMMDSKLLDEIQSKIKEFA